MENDSFRTIESLGRDALIGELSEHAPSLEEPLLKGIGDDAAVWKQDGDAYGLFSSETFMEGVDFDLTYTPLHHLGYKIASAGVSDIYAMNGSPKAVLVNLAVPNKLSVDMLKEIYRGIYAAGNDYGIQVAGGDLTASHQFLSVSISCYGTVSPEALVERSGARKDDAVCVTGDLGGAIAGLRILMREKKLWEQEGGTAFQPDLEGYEYVVKRQLVPVARKDFVDTVREQDIVPTAMIDISQGLVSDLSQLCKASSRGAFIYQAAIPIGLETRKVADEMKEDVDRYALYGGEDLELLFTLGKDRVEELAEHMNDFAVIGRITEEKGFKMQTAEGDVVEFSDQQ